MRIERLDLAPYGHFSQRSLALSRNACLHVVLGANESGKTTTLSAIGDLLFGFLPQTRYGFLHDQQQLRIGGLLRLGDGSTLSLRRRKGNKDTLSDGEGKLMSEDALRRALGGVDRKTFETEFGLTAQALREGGKRLLAAGGALAETLAAGSAALSGLSALGKRLGEEADALLNPDRRSAGKPFYVALDGHDAAMKKLREATVDSAELAAAQKALDEAVLRGVDLLDLHKAHAIAINRRKRARRVAGKLKALQEVAQALALLDGLPEATPTGLDEARKALIADALKREERERLAAEEAEGARRLAPLPTDDPTARESVRIEALNRQLGAAEQNYKDLPNRHADQESARLELDEIARRLGLPDHAALLADAPTDAEIARAKALIEARKRERRRRAEAVEGHRDALAERARLQATHPQAAADPAPLKRRLDALDDILQVAQAWRRERGQIEREARALTEDAAALDPPVADLEACARLPLPPEADLLARAKAEQGADEAVRGAEQKLADAARDVAAREAQLDKLRLASQVATRADWEAARAKRETAFDHLGAGLDGDAGTRGERFATVRAFALLADATGERLLDGAAQAAKLQAARDELDTRRTHLAAQQERLRDAVAARDGELETSRALWRRSGVAAEGSAKMARWRRDLAALLSRRGEVTKRRADLDANAEKIAAARKTLAGWLVEAGAPAPAGSDFEEAHRAAGVRLDELTAAWLAAQRVEIARQEADKTIARLELALREIEATEAKLAQEWPPTMARLRARAEATPEEADAALAAWGGVALPRFKLHEASDRIAKIGERIAQFERDAAATIALVAPDLAGTPGVQAAPRLTALLTAARTAAAERERLLREAHARAAKFATLDVEQAALAAQLERLRAQFGAADDDALSERIERLDQRQKREREQLDLRNDLREMGDGLDEAQLRAEQETFDLAALPSEIEVAEQEQTRRLSEIAAAGEDKSAAQRRLDALAQGRDAAGAARERKEAAGELIDIAERWLLRATAAKLAQIAIERHRAAAQNPLIARAGQMFAIATAGSFVGLDVSFDEADNPLLVARRAAGKPVRPDGLSEGACDQLFLSLRLALLELRAGEPLPFIGDDLLASFDDERTRNTLDLLAEFGARRQTILFTHHARVAELARGLAVRSIEVLEI